MEVHKHPHHVTHKKRWTEYLLEFFMLFLAVFLGFVAENVRENSVERHKEKEYIESLVQDLKTDTANLSNVIRGYQNLSLKQDTLLRSFDSINQGYNKNFIRLLKSVEQYPDFIYSDATIQQLKSSGSFRLIRNKNAIDSINSYTSEVSKTFINTDDLGLYFHELANAESDFINYKNITHAAEMGLTEDEMQSGKIDFLNSHDPQLQNKFYNRIRNYHLIMGIITKNNFLPLQQHATRLIVYLQKEYHLEN